MSRFLSPILFLGAGAYVWWFNSQHTDRLLAFPFITALFPSLEGDLSGQGKASAAMMLGIGGLLLILALLRRRPAEPGQEP